MYREPREQLRDGVDVYIMPGSYLLCWLGQLGARQRPDIDHGHDWCSVVGDETIGQIEQAIQKIPRHDSESALKTTGQGEGGRSESAGNYRRPKWEMELVFQICG